MRQASAAQSSCSAKMRRGVSQLTLRSCRSRCIVRAELHGSADHDDGSWMTSGLITNVSQCFRTFDKETAAQTGLISNDPVAAAILTDHKDLRPLTRRKFGFCCLFRLRVSDLLGSLSADAHPPYPLGCAAFYFCQRSFMRTAGDRQHSCDICYRSVIGHCARPGLRLVC